MPAFADAFVLLFIAVDVLGVAPLYLSLTGTLDPAKRRRVLRDSILVGGATSAVFSLVNAVLLRPLGYEEPERMMMIHEIIPESRVPRFGVSPADFLDMREYQTSFTDLGIYRTRPMELSGIADPESIVVAEVSAAVFPLLGVNAAEGRTFLPEEDQAVRSVIFISDELRRRRFAASSPIGERLLLDRQRALVALPGAGQVALLLQQQTQVAEH